MSIPIIFYMFLNSFAPIIVNDNFLTTIVFDEPVAKPHTGASSSEIYIAKSPDGKMLFIKSIGSSLNTNLNVPTKSGKLYSFLIKSGNLPHSVVHIKDGKKDQSFRDIKNLRGVIISDSNFITKIFNGTKENIEVNSMIIHPEQNFELPKGAPVFLNKERVYR